ncbi:MAG TPA: septal ring lytic transglycosylase RlpA family protein [Acidobacteriaceae bacterium]|nr:septal ring lytic transglycosylase RlpA family protein [Acidobacteriaceae bacterium]
MRFAAHRRWVECFAVLSALVGGVAGCHHKDVVAYQPAPPLVQDDLAVRRPVSRNPVQVEENGPPVNSELEPQGRPVSSEVGLASWYGPPYHNRRGADGTVYDQNAMTAAHRELPMGSVVRVTNLANGASVFVRITDRGPFIDGRILDLSLAAAKAVDVYRAGVAKVRVEAYAPPERPGVDPAGKWCVQIGAFLDEADAIQLKNDLLRRYATAKVIEFAGPTGHWVRIDPKNDTRAVVSQIADTIHIPDPGTQPYIVRLN